MNDPKMPLIGNQNIEHLDADLKQETPHMKFIMYQADLDHTIVQAIRNVPERMADKMLIHLFRIRERILDTALGKKFHKMHTLDQDVLNQIIETFDLDPEVLSMERIQEIADVFKAAYADIKKENGKSDK